MLRIVPWQNIVFDAKNCTSFRTNRIKKSLYPPLQTLEFFAKANTENLHDTPLRKVQKFRKVPDTSQFLHYLNLK